MIHHYTTIDNLALILESRKIRFTRLDLLDDIKEIAGLDDQILKLHKSIFVSSWTEDNEKNIPLWKMYASIMNGVRISMPQIMFQQHLITPFTEENYQNSRTYYSTFTANELFQNGKYLIINEFDYNGTDFYKAVEYN